MIVQKLLGKLEKLLGGDALETRYYEMPVYDFKVEGCDNELKVVEGHYQTWREGNFVVLEGNDDVWAKGTVYPINGGEMAMKTFNGFKETTKIPDALDFEKEYIGETQWEITVDVAAGTIKDINRTEVRI